MLTRSLLERAARSIEKELHSPNLPDMFPFQDTKELLVAFGIHELREEEFNAFNSFVSSYTAVLNVDRLERVSEVQRHIQLSLLAKEDFDLSKKAIAGGGYGALLGAVLGLISKPESIYEFIGFSAAGANVGALVFGVGSYFLSKKKKSNAKKELEESPLEKKLEAIQNRFDERKESLIRDSLEPNNIYRSMHPETYAQKVFIQQIC